MEPEEANKSYLMHLAIISKTTESWLQSIPMTTALAECLEAVSDHADIEMKCMLPPGVTFFHSTEAWFTYFCYPTSA